MFVRPENHYPIEIPVKAQSKRDSLLESVLNTASGFVISYVMWIYIVAPLFDIPTTHVTTFWITCLFTVSAIARNYVWRRLFNKRR